MVNIGYIFLLTFLTLLEFYIIFVVCYFQELNNDISNECGQSSFKSVDCETYNSISKKFLIGSEVYESCNDYNISTTPSICIKTAKEICEKRNKNFCQFNKNGHQEGYYNDYCKHEFSCTSKVYVGITLIIMLELLIYCGITGIFYFSIEKLINKHWTFKQCLIIFLLKNIYILLHIITLVLVFMSELTKVDIILTSFVGVCMVLSFGILLIIKKISSKVNHSRVLPI
jgi:hypothetical protein